MKQRFLYPDICKFIAIFLVTWSHSAQCVSGQTWPNFLCGNSIDISFNMPLFMLISGWFINPAKLRITNNFTFLLNKFRRLIVPALAWFLLHAIISVNLPDSLSDLMWLIKSIINYYWYLTALFVCLTIILFSAKVFKNNYSCILCSTLLVLVCPFSEIANINFMFPFIWAGYGLRKLFEKHKSLLFVILCSILGVILGMFWSPCYTVYISPLIPLHLTIPMICIYLYRFVIGFCISTAIIYIVKTYEKSYIICFAKLGQYSLVIYTASITILHILSLVLNKFDYHLNQKIVLELVSLLICIIIIFLTIIFSNLCRKNKWTRELLLGEYSQTKKYY